MNIEIANRLVKLRKEKGFSQEQLPEELGISRQAVSKWERAESSPDTDNLICLAKLYNVSLDELLNTEDSISTIKEEQIERDVDDDFDEDEELILENKFLKIFSSLVPILCVVIYLLLGFILNWWHPGWVVFFLIPIYYSVLKAIYNINLRDFAFPVLIVFIYILLGSLLDWWHPGWLLFLAIPIYEIVIEHIRK